MHFCGVAEVVEDGVIGDDGQKVVCDTIVCATGFGEYIHMPSWLG